MDKTLSIFELAAWLGVKPREIIQLTEADEPLPIFDQGTMTFLESDVRAWLHRIGIAAPGESRPADWW